LNKKNNYDFNNKKTACSSLLLIAEKSGELKRIKYDKVNAELEEFQLDYKVGERVRKFEVGPDRIGHIIKIEDESLLDESFLQLIEETKVAYIIIEEYITGQEFGAQASVRNGKIDFIMPHGDILFHSKTDVPIGHYVPYSITNEIYEDTVEQIKKSIVALDLDNCAINADFMLSNNQVYVLEIGARAGATNLPELVSIYYGINYYKYILDLALNKKNNYDFNNKKTACSSLLLIAEKSGELKRIKYDKVNAELEEFQLDYKVGERVRKFEVGPDRIGHIIMKTNEIIDEKIIDEISNVSKQIDIEIT